MAENLVEKLCFKREDTPMGTLEDEEDVEIVYDLTYPKDPENEKYNTYSYGLGNLADSIINITKEFGNVDIYRTHAQKEGDPHVECRGSWNDTDYSFKSNENKTNSGKFEMGVTIVGAISEFDDLLELGKDISRKTNYF